MKTLEYFPLQEEELAYTYEDMEDNDSILPNSYNESVIKFSINWEDLT